LGCRQVNWLTDSNNNNSNNKLQVDWLTDGQSLAANARLAEKRKEQKRKENAFWREFNEKPSFIPGCPGLEWLNDTLRWCVALLTCLPIQWAQQMP